MAPKREELKEGLLNLKVDVRSGENLIEYPPVFSLDSKTLYVIQKRGLMFYDTANGQCVGRFVTPNMTMIANVMPIKGDGGVEILVIITADGQLLHVNSESLETTYSGKITFKTLPNFPGVEKILYFTWPAGTDEMPECVYLLCQRTDEMLPAVFSLKLGQNLSPRHLCSDIVYGTHSIACGSNGNLFAAVQEKFLFVKDVKASLCKWHGGGTRTFTGVAVHPRDWICATADNTGRVVVWGNVLERFGIVAKTVFHWHTLPVGDFCFSFDGSNIYSGGGECTLIKWDVHNSENKRAVPRLGLPIVHIRSSVRNDLIAIAQSDNRIKIINSYNEIVSRIQNLIQFDLSDKFISDNFICFRVGLHLNPNNNALVTNGSPGHLQCYLFEEDLYLPEIDVTNLNFITSERHKVIVNTDVVCLDFSKTGRWMATVEERLAVVDSSIISESRAKFWKFNDDDEIFTLTNAIEWPHQNGVNSLKFQPIDEDDPTLMVVTTGKDKLCKLWGLSEHVGAHGRTEWWSCEYGGGFGSKRCDPISFSDDGSVFAVGFENVLTIWNSENGDRSLVLSNGNLTSDIKEMLFGGSSESHLVATCYAECIAVWDLSLAEVTWNIPVRISSLCRDPLTGIMAAFSGDGHVIFFYPDDPKPVAVRQNVTSSEVICSQFVSAGGTEEENNFKTKLFFINKSKELGAMLSQSDEKDLVYRIKNSSDSIELTSFGKFALEYKGSVAKKDYSKESSSVSNIVEGYRVLQEIMEQTPNTMPSISYYCSKLLRSLSIKKSPSDEFRMMEDAIKSSFSKRKHLKQDNENKDLEDEVSFVEEDVPSPTKDTLPETDLVASANADSNAEKISLDQVAGMDLSWLNNMFAS